MNLSTEDTPNEVNVSTGVSALKASIVGGELQPRDHDEVTWVLPSHLSTMDLAPADVRIAKALMTPATLWIT